MVLLQGCDIRAEDVSVICARGLSRGLQSLSESAGERQQGCHQGLCLAGKQSLPNQLAELANFP